jgi:hypothetical protein
VITWASPREHCPACGSAVERSSNITGNGPPMPGDILLCINCADMQMIDAAFAPVSLNRDERASIMANRPLIRAAVAALHQQLDSRPEKDRRSIATRVEWLGMTQFHPKPKGQDDE